MLFVLFSQNSNLSKVSRYAFISFLYGPSKITRIEFEDGSACESIGDSAFYGCTSLTSITIPDSVTSIGSSAFSGCTNIEHATIPAHAISSIIKTNLKTVVITSGESYAFKDCTSLTSIVVLDGNTTYKSIDGNLYSFDGKVLIQYAIGKTATSFTIPDSVESIGENAFSGCTSLKSVIIPDSVKSIGNYAFYKCTTLTSMTIPNSVESIGNYAFYGCDSLTSIEIPDSVTTIGNYAFHGCTSLTSITIPDSVISIGNWAFYWCTSLKTVVIGGSVTSIGEHACRGWGADKIYYKGTSSDWSTISISANNDSLFASDDLIYYYSETEPMADGEYWHYVDGVPTLWK